MNQQTKKKETLKLQIHPVGGGQVSVLNYNCWDDEEMLDKGYFSVMNPKGMGYSEYITPNNLTSVLKAITGISWISEHEKNVATEFVSRMTE